MHNINIKLGGGAGLTALLHRTYVELRNIWHNKCIVTLTIGSYQIDVTVI